MTPTLGRLLVVSSSRTRRAGEAYGSGRMRTASTTLKTAVLTPIPSARIAMTAAVKSGL